MGIARRGFLGSLLGITGIPFSELCCEPKQPDDLAEYLRNLIKYVKYSVDDYKRCRFILFDGDRKLWAPPIVNVVICSGAYSVIMRCQDLKVTEYLSIARYQFIDMDGIAPDTPRLFPRSIQTIPGDIFRLTYTFNIVKG